MIRLLHGPRPHARPTPAGCPRTCGSPRGRSAGPLVLALLAALAAAGACKGGAPEEQPVPPGAAQGSEAPPAQVARPLTPDERLAEDVRSAFLQAPALAHEDIKIAVVQGQVLLAGQVSAPHLRDEAVQVAGEVPGVKRVQAKLVVKRR